MKVGVVGAGVMGLATARVLAQRGHDVTVYEQFELNTSAARVTGRRASSASRTTRSTGSASRSAPTSCGASSSGSRAATLLELNGLVDVQRVPRRRVEALRGAGVP